MPGPIQYPGGDDYANALGNARRCLRDASLHAFAPELDARGDPKVRTGGFAYVFKLEHPTGDVAVKFFKSDDEQRTHRYQLIDEHLRRLSCPYLVGFQYQPRGLKWGGEHFPLLRMDWVGGKPLFNWMAGWGAAPRRDAAALRSMADRWVALMQSLAAGEIAHGDLQHGNVLVMADGSLVLVDYDGMCVPAMVAVGMRSREDGLPAYQHPQRPGLPMGVEMDDFSAWVVWLTLRGLAADPGLWDRHNQVLENNVLFSPADMQKPDESALWAALLKSPDAEVRERARPLLESLRGPIASVPRFRFDPRDELAVALKKVPRDWAAVAALADAVRAANLPLSPEARGPADEARSRRDSRDGLRRAVDSGDAGRIAAAYEPAKVDDWPACQPLVAVAKLAGTLKQTTDGRDFLLSWEKHGGLPEAAAFRADAERWTRRLAALAKLEAALDRRAGEVEIVAAWHELQGAGGHPEMVATETRLALALARVALLEKLRAVPPEEGEDSDRALCAAWDESLLAGWAEVEPYRTRREQAPGRLEALGTLNEHLAALPPQPDEAHYERIGRAAAALPEDYSHPRANVVRFVRRWLADREALAAACARGDLGAVVALAAALNPPAASLEDRVRDARTQVEARRRLGDVLKSGSIRRVAKADLPKPLDDWAAGPEQLARASAALELVKQLPELEAAAREPGDGRELLRLWGRYENVPPGWQELDEARRVVDAWRPRVGAADEVIRLATGGRFRAGELVEAWRRLHEAGGHPDVARYEELARTSERRLHCLERLAKVRAAETEDADRALIGAWDEDLLGDWWEAEAYRARLEKATGRLALRGALARSIAARAPDEDVLKSADDLPPGYLESPDLTAGVAGAKDRLARFRAAGDALDADPPSDLAIAAAWDACGTDVRSRFSPERQDRCRLAERRRVALGELRRPAANLADDFADQATLRIWREGELGDCHDLTPEERDRHGLASRRDRCWRDLNAALEGGRHAEARALMADPVLANYPPFVERRAVMQEELEESAHQAAILDYLAAGGPDETLDSLELSGVEAHPNLYRAHADGLRRLLEQAIGTASLREVASPEFDRDDTGRLRVVRLRLGWSWRHLGLGDRLCLVAAHPERFLDHPKEGRPYTAGQQSTSMRGVPVATPPGARQVYVTLWPVLKLRGLDLQAVGKPLHRGPFAVEPEDKAAGSWLGRMLKRGARGA